MKYLLAKSYDQNRYQGIPPDYALLTQHSRDVASACKALAANAGKTALLNAEIELAEFESFQLALLANGWCQDLGKANSHFQQMVSGEHQLVQLLRHETISGILLILNQQLSEWLVPLSKYLLMSVWGALGHHRKFDKQTAAKIALKQTVYLSHPDFTAILVEMANDLELTDPPSFQKDLLIVPSKRDGGDLSANQALNQLFEQFEEAEEDFNNELKRRLLALIKGFGIAADVAASAIAKRGKSVNNYSLTTFINESIGNIGLSVEDLTRLINRWAWDKVDCDPDRYDESRLPDNFVFRDFQTEVALSNSHLTFAQAGCGSGKSLAAYLWAQEWCKKFIADGRTNFRLFFCLPTTGTTTEHFKDYALESGIDASLSHSRSLVDLKIIAETTPQEESDLDETDLSKAAQDALRSANEKIDALNLWSTPLVVTTADTVLGLMSNARRAIYSLPAIMNSAIVFDEIHAFDDQMFGHLVVFLKNFPKLPVLLMTASLPDDRLDVLKTVRPDLFPVNGPAELELLERYNLKYSLDDNDIWQSVDQCLANGGKVLWVSNRVDWANKRYNDCLDRYKNIDTTVDIYHSRLRYRDRSRRHRRVIDRFKKKDHAAILIATQVAEMSLDISADLLITDIAAVPSLIQRLGRLNRRATPENNPGPKLCLISSLPIGEANIELPYQKDEIGLATQWINRLIDYRRALSQRDLANEFSQISESKLFDLKKAEERACFFSGLWQTRPGMTRAPGYTITVVLQKDLEECTDLGSDGEPTQEWFRNYEVAIPIKKEALKWPHIGTTRVAPKSEIIYDYDDQSEEGTGAKWRKN